MKSAKFVGNPVARSLKLSGSTHTVVAALSAAVALNGLVGMQALHAVGQAVLVGVIFASLAAGSAAICVDILGRSTQAIASLRSIGASRGSISSALIGPVLVYGAAGSAAGAIVGAALGATLVGAPLGAGLYVDVPVVIVASAAAMVAGVYAGGRVTWSR